MAHVIAFLFLDFPPFPPWPCLGALCCPRPVNEPFYFLCRTFLFLPAVQEEVCIWMPQHYLLTTNYPSSTTSQGFYNPVTILSPTICCKFWPGRKKKTKNKKLAVWPCPWTQENRSGKGLRRSPAEHQQLNFEPRRSRKATLVCTILSNVCQGHQRANQLEYEGRAIEMTFKTNPTTPSVAFAAAIYHCTETYHYLA